MPLIRRALTEDINVMSHIHATVWRQSYRGLVPDAYLDALADNQWVPFLTNGLKYDGMKGYLSIHQGKPVGVITLGSYRNLTKDPFFDQGWGEIYSLYVLPPYMKTGQGKALLLHALSSLKSSKFHHCALWVAEKNQNAIAFYRHMGFSPDDMTLDMPVMGLQEVRYSIPL